jgi:hypothetical protein
MPNPGGGDPITSGYGITPSGLVTLRQDATMGVDQFAAGGDDNVAYYRLPNDVVLTIDKSSGKILALALGGTGEASFDLTNATFVRNGMGAVTGITITNPGDANAFITFTADGRAQMAIGENGATFFVERSANDLGWLLPNGVKVYYKQAFIQNGQVVAYTFIGSPEAGKKLFVLEDLFDAAITQFHVVKMTEDENKDLHFDEG